MTKQKYLTTSISYKIEHEKENASIITLLLLEGWKTTTNETFKGMRTIIFKRKIYLRFWNRRTK